MNKALTAVRTASYGTRWLLTLVFSIVIVILSVTPARSRPGDTVFHWLVENTAAPVQKLSHVAVYAMLAVMVMWALENVEARLGRAVLTLLIVVSLGAVLEWYQLQVPGRFGSLTDVALNLAGAIIGIAVAWFLF